MKPAVGTELYRIKTYIIHAITAKIESGIELDELDYGIINQMNLSSLIENIKHCVTIKTSSSKDINEIKRLRNDLKETIEKAIEVISNIAKELNNKRIKL